MVNGSLSAGGPLPAPCVHTCDISHQHLLSRLQALQACVFCRQSVTAQGQPHGLSDARALGKSAGLGGGMVGGGVMGGGPHDVFLPTLQRQCSLGVTLPLLAILRL